MKLILIILFLLLFHCSDDGFKYTINNENNMQTIELKAIYDNASNDNIIAEKFITLFPEIAFEHWKSDLNELLIQCNTNGNGAIVIPPDLARQLREQLKKEYIELNVKEKDKFLRHSYEYINIIIIESK